MDLNGVSLQKGNVLTPTVLCHKCGKKLWFLDAEPLTWDCLCGNQAYFTHGEVKQQIDAVLESSRGTDFVHSPTGTIVPKKSVVLTTHKFKCQLEKKLGGLDK